MVIPHVDNGAPLEYVDIRYAASPNWALSPASGIVFGKGVAMAEVHSHDEHCHMHSGEHCHYHEGFEELEGFHCHEHGAGHCHVHGDEACVAIGGVETVDEHGHIHCHEHAGEHCAAADDPHHVVHAA